jgi:4-amino-4-deoxy-L-arabinose transferase-like glycosyltransferase
MREKLNLIILIFILALGLGLRLYKLDIPLADHHSWRQADTAAVARNFAKDHWDFFKPRIDNMTPLHLGAPNSERLFMVEPPVYNSVVAGVYKIFGIEVRYARLVSIVFSLGAMVFLYFIVSHFLGKTTGLLSAFFFAILPFSVYYSRVVLPEPMILFLTLGMFWFAIKWLETDSNKDYLLLTAFSALSFTQKTFPLFFLLPLAYLFLKKFGLGVFKQKKLYLWAIVSFLPFVAWRWWVGHFPEGTPANLWLFNQGNIRFKGAFFHWIFAKRIGELILGFWGIALFVLGLVLKPKKEGFFFYFWLLAIFIYITVFAAGNVTHDYYQIPLIPILAVFLGKGVNFLLFERQEKFNRIVGVVAFIICTGLACAFSWYEIRGFYNIQSGVDLAGVAVDELTAKDALVLTGDSNDATLLYNTNRWGWTGGYASSFPNSKETIEKIKELGGTIYVTTKFDRNSDFGRYMTDNYQVLKETDQYIIFDLTSKEADE